MGWLIVPYSLQEWVPAASTWRITYYIPKAIYLWLCLVHVEYYYYYYTLVVVVTMELSSAGYVPLWTCYLLAGILTQVGSLQANDVCKYHF